MTQSRVFFVTGTSSGFGHALVQHILDGGDKVAAASRNPSKLSFKNTTGDNYLPVDLDLGSIESIQSALDATLQKFGRIDVVVNNAGYVTVGPFESYTEEQMREQFDVNFFALANVTQLALKIMREQGGGLIQQISSMSAQYATPGVALYSASKWAVEGLTEGIAQELKPEWNIKITLVEPGAFSTAVVKTNSHVGAKQTPAYDHLKSEDIRKAFNEVWSINGDVSKAGARIYELAKMEDPPLRVVLGSDAVGLMKDKLEKYTSEVQKWEEFSRSTDISK